MVAGTEKEKTGLECRSDSGVGTGEDTPSNPEYLRWGDDGGEDEDVVEGEVTPPPHSPPCEAHAFLGDIFSTQVGITVSSR
jgi:hypothetical protein